MKKLFSALFTFFFFSSLATAKTLILIGEGENKREATLHHLSIDSELIGSVLVQKYEFSFYNDGKNATEGELQCDLPKGARIVEFSMDVLGEKRDGVVVSASKAVNAYESIVRMRTDPGLIEINEANQSFKMRVFPIESKKEKRVWITTVRLITDDKVDLQLEQLGVAKKASASILISDKNSPTTIDTTKWKFKQQQHNWSATFSAENKAIPPCKLKVNKRQERFKYSKGDKTYFASTRDKSKHIIENYNGNTKLWWDGSIKLTPSLLAQLQKWLMWKKEGEIELIVLRETPTSFGQFTLKNGQCDQLLKKLHTIKSYGMARPSLLDWQAKHSGVIIVSDGKFAEGNKGIPEKTTYPLFYLTDSKQHSLLNALSNSSQLLPETLTDRYSSIYQSHILQTGMTTKAKKTAAFKAVEHKVAYWLWAMNTAKLYADRGYDPDTLETFHQQHKVAGDNYSWIVLESLDQHIQYKIRPPETKPEMLKKWLERNRNLQQIRQQYVTSLKTLWKNHCNALLKKQLSYKETVVKLMENNHQKVTTIQGKDLNANDRKFYLQAKQKLELLTTDREVYLTLIDYVKKHRQTIKKLKVMWVNISGQVGNPGPKKIMRGTTIHEVVKQATPNTFAALNRIQLMRNGKVYRYNMKLPNHQKLRLYSNDQLYVPQVNWLGCGGSRGDHEAFQPEEPTTTIKFTGVKLVWDKSKPYLKELSELKMEDESVWLSRYLKWKETYGWKSEFYQDISCMLEDRKLHDLANIVASDLAELHPSNANTLRKSAQIFYRTGELEIAESLLLRIQNMTLAKDVAHYDLGRLYEKKGDFLKATTHYWQAVQTYKNNYNMSQGIVYLEELNACIHKGNIDVSKLNIPLNYVRFIPVETRVLLLSDTVPSTTNIIIQQNLLGNNSAFLNGSSEFSKWIHSTKNNSHQGIRSCSVKSLDPDNYIISAKFISDQVYQTKSSATLTLEIIKNFGSPNETRETVTRRVKKGESIKMITLDKQPKKN